jgi:hypothetical protein
MISFFFAAKVKNNTSVFRIEVKVGEIEKYQFQTKKLKIVWFFDNFCKSRNNG